MFRKKKSFITLYIFTIFQAFCGSIEAASLQSFIEPVPCIVKTAGGRETSEINLLVIKAAYTKDPENESQAIIAESIIETVEQYGCTVNEADSYGITPLHIAVDKNMATIVKTLLDLGAKPDLKVENQESKFYGKSAKNISNEMVEKHPSDSTAKKINEMVNL